jgi:hypothetical protein
MSSSPIATWETLDWPALDRLRAGFLDGGAARGPYWKSPHDLAVYDLTYGERIGWKWDAVLRELRLRSLLPSSVHRWIAGPRLGLRQRHRRAPRGRRARSRPGVAVGALGSFAAGHRVRRRARAHGVSRPGRGGGPGHGARARCAGRQPCVERTRAVRPGGVARAGRPRSSRALGRTRDPRGRPRPAGLARGLRAGGARIVAPCTHQEACGLLRAGEERHWCHHFAPPLAGVHADRNWVRFAQRAGIDLRSLPYAYLIADRGHRRRTVASRHRPVDRASGAFQTLRPDAELRRGGRG